MEQNPGNVDVTREEDLYLMSKDAVFRMKAILKEQLHPSRMSREDLQRLVYLMKEALSWFDQECSRLDAENRLLQEMLEEQGVSRAEYLSRTMDLVTEDYRRILHNFWE